MNKIFELLDTDLLIALHLIKVADIVLLVSVLLSFLPFTTLFTLIVFSILSYYYYLNDKYIVSLLSLIVVFSEILYYAS